MTKPHANIFREMVFSPAKIQSIRVGASYLEPSRKGQIRGAEKKMMRHNVLVRRRFFDEANKEVGLFGWALSIGRR